MVAPHLIVDCYVESRPASLEVFLPRNDHPFELVAAARGPLEALPTDASPYASILFTGSAAHVLDGAPWSERLAALVRSAAQHRTPTLGVCFGHQLLAYALFGAAAIQRSPTPEYGWKDIELLYDDDSLARATRRASCLNPGSATTFRCFTSHKDELAPHFPGKEKLRITARSTTCPIEAFEHHHLPLRGIQFHPELPPEVCRELLEVRSREHPELGLDVASEAQRRTDTAALWREIRGPLFQPAERAA
jgi:GMP synthase (glutamine-hydrolysing)